MLAGYRLLDAKSIIIYPAEIGSLILVQGNSLVAVSVPTIKGQILATKIIECESGGRPEVCNAKYGCNAGMGLFQLIPSTVKYCEEKLGKPINPFNAEENKECGNWLLENEGTRHWGGPDTNWGSWECWGK